MKRLLAVVWAHLSIITFAALVLWWLVQCYKTVDQNGQCDKACIEQGYPAGECMSLVSWKHDVCVCWPELTKHGQTRPAGHFLLRRD